jgi:cellulose synthase/poly-beta-1,6-N-acetylglucosamine synthase-like glycosyltransferase
MTAHDVTLYVYNLTLLPIIFFSVLFIVLVLINLFMDKKEKKYPAMKDLPFISVQIPTFNDPIAERCVKRCLQFDYPRDKYEIIIADDSTNPQTQKILKAYALQHPGFVKYIHRENREGFKAGALMNARSITKGDILVIFDSDWTPKKDFLKKIIPPFADPKVAIVQSRQGFCNKNKNLITRFASYLLMVYHTIVMPINDNINCVFFCGTAGALRKSAFEKVGGWNPHSITEDADLSLRLLKKGYKTVYLEMETLSEVPETFESFTKQQMRWCYGNVRVFSDNWKQILFGRGFSWKQRAMILFITLGNITAPVVLLMTIFGFGGWFIGEPGLFNYRDFLVFLSRFLLTAGFLIMGIITLWKHKMMRDFPYLVLASFTMGLVLAIANSIAFFRAVANKKLHWFCTPKAANTTVVR